MKTSGSLDPNKNNMNLAMKTSFILLAFTVAMLGSSCQNRVNAPFSGSSVLTVASNVLNISSKINIAEIPAASTSVQEAPIGPAEPYRELVEPNPQLTTTHN